MDDDPVAPVEARGYDIAGEGSFEVSSFDAQGPVGRAFLADRTTPFRALMGPWGSGKTNLVFMDLHSWAVEMPLCRIDGRYVRPFKGTTCRDTYRNLKATLQSWHGWYPPNEGEFTGGVDRPAMHRLEFALPDGSTLQLQHEFIAIGDQSVEQALLGYEGNWFNMEEWTTLSPDLATYAWGRLGRYPRPDLLVNPADRFKRPRRMVATYNAPEEGHHVYDYFEVNPKPDFSRLYKQPSGLAPDAENLNNLPPNYYQDQVAANDKWWVRRFVENKYGFSRAGQPVFADEYDDDLHCARDAPKLRDMPIRVGIDGGMGLHPAMVVYQWTTDGQFIAHREVYLGRCGPQRFADAARAAIERDFPRLRIEAAHIDPSALFGLDKESGETGFVDILSRALGCAIVGTDTNEISTRLAAISSQLMHRTLAGPALVISPRCTWLRRGFNNQYRYRKDLQGQLTSELKPDKTEASHIMDALQYGVLGSLGSAGIIRLTRPRASATGAWGERRQPDRIAHDFDVWRS